MTKVKHLHVPEMDGMKRADVKLTNEVANCLVAKHHMCLDCAIVMSVAFVKGRNRPPGKGVTSSKPFCSEACAKAFHEFVAETLGGEFTKEYIGDMPSTKSH